MRVLITGITGFVGSHLAEYLLSAHPEVEVFGLRRWRSVSGELEALYEKVRMVDGDLLDPSSLQRALSASRPDMVFHLAASSSVASSWDTPAEMLQVNALGSLHLLEAIRQLDLDAPVVLAGSAECYGAVPATALPVKESQPFAPISPYAVSKATVDMLAFQYFQTFRLRTVRLRLFNHFGPRQSERFVISALARQIAFIEAEMRSSQLHVGNLEARRDFVDVRDVVRAYWLAATVGEAGAAYNVASGVSRSIREVLDQLLVLTEAVVDVVFDPGRLRPADIPELVGDAGEFRRVTGWAPGIAFEQSLYDCLAYWRRRIHR